MPMSDWSTTNLSNGTTLGINIAENCPAENVNNALREIMAQTRAAVTTNSLTMGGGLSWSGVSNYTIGLSSGNPIFQGDTGDYYLIDRAGSYHTWFTGGSERLRITLGGRVGIGITAPSATLQVVGASTVDGQVGTAAIFGAGAGADLFLGSTDGAPFVGAQGTNPLNFSVNGSNKISVDSSGNLNILGLSNYYLGCSGAVASIQFDTGDSYSYDRSGNRHSFKVGGFERFAIDSNGLSYTSPNLYEVGYRDKPTYALLANATLLDAYRGFTAIPAGDINIAANATFATTNGYDIDIINTLGSSINITPAGGVTLVWSPSGGTGARVLAAKGWATIRKIDTNTWYITGTGIS